MIDLQTIQKASSVIAPYVWYTPLRPSYYFSERTGFDVYLKMENWQPTGSFKVRGAVHFSKSLSPREQLQGVVAWSAGNHGLGVAYAAKAFDMPATIFVPRSTPASKLEKFRYFPVELRMEDSYDECEIAGREFARQSGAMILHPYDDWRTVAGQATVGLEIREAMPEVDAIVVPVGGGGLISGIGIAVKSVDPEIKIIGVQSALSPSLQKSLDDGVCYEQFPANGSIAEGIAGGIGKIVFELAPKYIDEIVLVDEERIRWAIAELTDHEQVIVEPSGAAAIAALDQIESVPRASRLAVVLTGGNLSPILLREIVNSY